MQESTNQRVKKIRKILKLNQRDFSKSLGVTQTGISQIETEVHGVSANVLIKIVEVFNVNANWILTGLGQMFLHDNVNLDKSYNNSDPTEVFTNLKRALMDLSKEELSRMNDLLQQENKLLRQRLDLMEGILKDDGIGAGNLAS